MTNSKKGAQLVPKSENSTFPVTSNAQCFKRWAIETMELFDMEAQSVSPIRPCILIKMNGTCY